MTEPAKILAGRYRVVRRLGAGAMATVYLTEDLQLDNCKIACKVLHPHLRATTSVARRFAHEVIAARRIRHDAVVEIFDLVESDDELLITMAYVRGHDTAYLVRRDGPFPPDEAVRIGALVSSGLASAHKAGVVHGDVKPHNILVGDGGVVKLVDFGMAKVTATASATAHSLSFGTPDYVAPELLTDRFADARADIYSLGATLFELLTGRPPFVAETPYALIKAKASKKAPSVREVVPSVPEWLDRALSTALAPNPEDRFQSADALAEALLAADATALQPRTTASERSCRHCEAPMLTELPFCFSCGRGNAPFRQDPTLRHRVAVFRRIWVRGLVGADPLSYDDKFRIVEHASGIAQSTVADPRRIERRMKAPPFIVADHLDSKDAKRLAEDLAVRGMKVKRLDHGWRGTLRFLSNEPAAVPALLLGPACIASAAAVFTLYGHPRMLFGAAAFFIPILIILGLLERQRLRPITELVASDADTTSSAPVELGWLLPVAQRLHGVAQSDGLVRTIARLLARVVRLQSVLPESFELKASLGSTFESVERLCEAIQRSDDFLVQTDERMICQAMEQLDRDIELADGAESERLVQLRLQQVELLEERANVEAARGIAYTRLLEISTKLGAMHARTALAASSEAEATLSTGLAELEDELESWALVTAPER